MKNLFVYGSLMFDEVWDKIISSRHRKVPAQLHGFARYSVAGETYPGLRKETNNKVDGLLVYGLNKKDIAALDRFEGHYYQRQRVTVTVAETGEINCETYLFKSSYLRLLSNQTWSADAFREKHLKKFLVNYFANRG